MFNILTFTGFHTWLSLIALASGALLIVDLLTSRLASRLTILFFVTAVAANVTGFLLPFTGFLPSHGVGIISSLTLLLALLARYGFHLAGAWRWLYAVCFVVGVYFLAFVAIAQIFQKVPALAAMGQTPFAIAETALLIIAIVLAIKAAKAYRPTMMAAAA
ncbi:MAG: hypothetical protein JWO28_598 [Hyphomicrobiales bacterium]|nr:hypothetical protein [Hyphomicrobiales bacterium]